MEPFECDTSHFNFLCLSRYMKYLYPYECEKLKLSSLSELQSAIDGNRREGRRPGYGYDFSPIPSMLNTPMTPHMNGPLCPMPTNRTMGLPSNGEKFYSDDSNLLLSFTLFPSIIPQLLFPRNIPISVAYT